MDMESSHRAMVCGGLILLGAIFCVANIVRSVKLKKGFSEHTIKMYIAFVVFIVLGVIGIAGVVSGDALAGLFGAAAGYALGNKPWEGAKDQ
jgi:hypothetical protein